MVAEIAERERLERIRQGYLVEEGEPGPSVAGRIREPSFTPPPSESTATPLLQPRQLRTEQSRPTRAEQPRPPLSAADQASTEGTTQTYPVPTGPTPGVSLPGRTVDPSAHTSKEELRRVAEEDTRRRMAELGVETRPGRAEQSDERESGFEGVGLGGGGLAPRRRGGR